MKAIIASDTHGYFAPLSNYILENNDVDLLIHAGDGVEDVKTIHMETNIPFYVVRGNNDYNPEIPLDRLIEVEGIKIFLAHGHTYGVDYSYDEIIDRAKDLKADIVVFGHIHTYYNKDHDGILVLNPGSVSLPRDNNPGFMVLEVKGKDYKLERVELKQE